MKHSLTFGDALLQLVFREVFIMKGKEIYPKIAESATRVQIPEEVGSMLDNLERMYYIHAAPLYKLIIADPWVDAVEKVLGYKLPKRGMSAYFAFYLRGLASFRESEKNLAKLKSRLAEAEAGLREIDRYLEHLASNIFHCSVDDLSRAMVEFSCPQSLVDDFGQKMNQFHQAKEGLEDIRKSIEGWREFSYSLYAQLALLEDMVKWPSRPSVRSMLIYLIQRLVGFARLSDFEKVREEAERFLQSPEGVRKVQLLSQRRRV